MSRVLGRAPSHTLDLLVPYQRVAMRVISQAFRDLEHPGEAPAARAFLAGSPMLHHWCALAELDVTLITTTAQLMTAKRAAAAAASPLDHRASRHRHIQELLDR